MSIPAVIPLTMPAVSSLNLSVDTKKCQLIQDGTPLKRQGKAHLFTLSSGEEIAVRVYNTVFDPAPQVKINGINQFLIPKLTLPQLMLVFFPFFAMIAAAGFLADTPSFPAIFGLLGANIAARIVRSDRSKARKVALTFLTTVCIGILLFISTAAWQIAKDFEGFRNKATQRYNEGVVAIYAKKINEDIETPKAPPGMTIEGFTSEGTAFVFTAIAPIKKGDIDPSKIDFPYDAKLICAFKNNPDLKDIDYSFIFRFKNTEGDVVYEKTLPSSTCP